LCNARRFRNLRKSAYVKWSQVKKNIDTGLRIIIIIIIIIMKIGELIRVGHVEHMGKEKYIQEFGERI
jgi:hypothetical protein